jgi:HlyD family secretion protein
VAIVPQISGIVSELYKEAGQTVQVGEIIAKIKVIPEMGTLNAAESRVKQSKLNLEQAQREYDRTKELFEGKVVVLEEYEKVETQLKLAKEELINAQDNLEIVRDGIAQRSSVASNTQIRSTISGMILDVPIKVGNSVIQANTFNAGTTIATVADMSDMIFRGNIDETEVGRVKEGMPILISVGALQDQRFDATLEYISPKSTENNGAILFEMKAAVKIPKAVFIRAGYSANAEIILDSRHQVFTIPESAVIFRDTTAFVNIYKGLDGEKQLFEERQVTVGLSDGINIEVKEGLTEQDQIRGAIKEETKSATNKEMKRYLYTIALIIVWTSLNAQTQPWSLEKCIAYGIEHNIAVKRYELAKENQEITSETTRLSRLPDLSANVGQTFYFGRTPDRDGVYQDQTGQFFTKWSTNFKSISADFRLPIKSKQPIGSECGSGELHKAGRRFSAITGYYLQMLQRKELYKIALDHLN